MDITVAFAEIEQHHGLAFELRQAAGSKCQLGAARVVVRVAELEGELEISGRIVILTRNIAVFAPDLAWRGWFDVRDELGKEATIRVADRINFRSELPVR